MPLLATTKYLIILILNIHKYLSLQKSLKTNKKAQLLVFDYLIIKIMLLSDVQIDVRPKTEPKLIKASYLGGLYIVSRNTMRPKDQFYHGLFFDQHSSNKSAG